MSINRNEGGHTMEAIFLNPVFKHNIWGGTGLREKYGYEVEGDDIGECWGIAAHQNGDCEVKNGSFAGMHLSELWKNHPELFGKNGDYTENHVFPLLIKIIDAKSDLSIQVHPDDAYAAEHENGSLGKTECWYILDCPDDACLVIGHNAGTNVLPLTMNKEAVTGQSELFATAALDKGTNELIIKIVNTGIQSKKIQLNLNGISSGKHKGKLMVLHASDLEAKNTLGKPETVIPIESAVELEAPATEVSVQPLSFLVYRISL